MRMYQLEARKFGAFIHLSALTGGKTHGFPFGFYGTRTRQ